MERCVTIGRVRLLAHTKCLAIWMDALPIFWMFSMSQPPPTLNISLCCQCWDICLASDGLQEKPCLLLVKWSLSSEVIEKGKHFPMMKQVWPLCLIPVPKDRLSLGTLLIMLPVLWGLCIPIFPSNPHVETCFKFLTEDRTLRVHKIDY